MEKFLHLNRFNRLQFNKNPQFEIEEGATYKLTSIRHL